MLSLGVRDPSIPSSLRARSSAKTSRFALTVRRGLSLSVSFLLAFSTARSATSAPRQEGERFRGGKVVWTRLMTDHPYWNRHSANDVRLLDLMRTHTALNIAENWQAADPRNLDQLCQFPFAYADNIAYLSAPALKNLAEYLRRGGFLLVDCCINASINPSPENFLRDQIARLASVLPQLEIARVRPEHEVFSIYFKLPHQPPQTHRNNSWSRGPANPLHALMLDGRVVAIIGLNGFQCGWDGQREGDDGLEVMQMVTNIYIFAMTR